MGAYMFCTVNHIDKRKPFPQDISCQQDVGCAIKNDEIPKFLIGINPLHIWGLNKFATYEASFLYPLDTWPEQSMMSRMAESMCTPDARQLKRGCL